MEGRHALTDVSMATEGRGGFDLDATVCEEVKVLARSLASRMAWRTGQSLEAADPVEADRQARVVADGMIVLMGCYGFRGDDGKDG